MGRDTVLGTFLVAVALCVVCSVLVSSAAVGLRDKQQANAALDEKKNILVVAGLVEDDAPDDQIDEVFQQRVRPVLVDLDTGEVVPESQQPYDEYSPRDAAATQAGSVEIETDGPRPGVDRRAKWSFVYHVMQEGSESTVEQYVIPIYGKGLWSTLYGFLSIDADGETIRGITFYEHGETPGLGGEVDNPNWKQQWEGKQAYDDQRDVAIQVIKGDADASDPHRVDGLSGATITSRGVSNFVQYWLGPDGFGPYLEKQTGGSANRATAAAAHSHEILAAHSPVSRAQ